MVNLLRPKYFVPVHGDYRHLTQHIEVVTGTGIPEKCMLIEDGEVLELTAKSIEKTTKVASGRILIDSGSTSDVVEDIIIRDRRHLSEAGLVLAIITIDKMTGKQAGPARDRNPRLRGERRRHPQRRAVHHHANTGKLQRRKKSAISC